MPERPSDKGGFSSYLAKNQKPVLNKNFEFKRVYRHGKSIVCPAAVIYVMPQKFRCVRTGITASKKLGCAVVRNRARRVIKAAFTPLLPKITGSYDIVLVCRNATSSMKSTEAARQINCALSSAGLFKQ